MVRSHPVVTALMCLSLSGVARAETSGGAVEPTPAQIRAAAEAFDLGREAYQRDEFVEAAEQFERADSQAPSSTAIEYALRAREKAGQLDRAATLATLARERHPNDANIAKLAPDLLERARRQLYELTVRCEEPCDLAVSGKIVHGAPSLSRVVFVTPGNVQVRAGFQGGGSAARDVSATAGGQGEVAFDEPAAPPVSASVSAPTPVAPVPAESPGETPPSSGWSPAVFWVGAGLTAVAGAATIWSGVDTLSNPGEDKVRRECARGDTECDLYRQGRDNQRRTNVLIGVTAGLGVSTIIVGAFLTNWSGSPRAAQGKLVQGAKKRVSGLSIEPWAEVGEGALLGARGRF